MKPLLLSDLNLSSNAENFVNDHLPHLDKPLQIGQLPDDYPHFATMIPGAYSYLIGVRIDVDKSTFDTNFCHELYHAYQISAGFPFVAGYSQDTQKYCENLRSTILDLSANEAVKAYGLTYDLVIKTRFRQTKHLCATAFKEINTPFAKDLLTINLILDLSDFSTIQQDNILQRLKNCLPDVYNLYHELHRIIYDQYDYRTKEGCVAIFAYIFDRIGLWNDCSIMYQGHEFRTPQALAKAIKPNAHE